MSSNLSQKQFELFFDAHRGISGKPDPNYGLGMHFSTSEHTATKRFALGKSAHWEPATVIHAQIPMSSIETDRKILGQRGYAGFQNKDPLGEEEIPVRQGAPIFVTGITTYSRSRDPQDNLARRKRTRIYKRPREMKA